jgi:hypothetical protein
MLDLREESFQKVTNFVIFPRILHQLGLVSFRVIWQHDANALTGDCVQWGWIRLPTKSYIIYFLALCGVTHYVYIHHDLKSMEIVGPVAGIHALIECSNAAIGARLNQTQLHYLQHAMGMGDAMTRADRVCTWWEKRICIGILCVTCLVFTVCALHDSWIILISVALSAGICLLLTIRRQRCSTCIRARLVSFWRAVPHTNEHADETSIPLLHDLPEYELTVVEITSSEAEVSDELDTPTDMEEPGLEEPRSSEAEVSDELDIPTDMEEPALAEPRRAESSIKCSLLTARSHYYEIVNQIDVIPETSGDVIRFTEIAQVYAMKLHPNFVPHLAERTVVPEGYALNICVYNPMIDPYLIEICENFKKGVDLVNLLLVVLPPLVTLSKSFRNSSILRNRTSNCARYVTTLADFETMLLQMTSGIFKHLVFVLPVNELTDLEPRDETWKSCINIVGYDNCHWLQIADTESTGNAV